MPVDDRDDAPAGASPEKEEKTVSEALQSETDEPLPPAAERIAERDADRPEPVTPQGQRRRYLTRRNAFIATIAVAVGIFAIIFIAMLIYRLGYVDRYVANQIVNTLAQYGIRAEIREFHLAFSPRTVEMLGLELYDQQTGTKLGTVDRLLATIRIEDLYALNLRRNVNLESLEVEGLEAWVTFDEQGRSNFRHIHLPSPDPNRRILFSYSTAHVKVSNSVVHYGDERYDIKGEARNIAITIQPDDPSAPAESWMNTVTFSASDSTFVYDGRPVNNIDIEARGRVDQTRAEIHELVLRSPLAEARLQGVMDDWRNLHYRMQITSSVDLTQASDILQAGASLRGVGNFTGNVSGEGTRYQVDGQISSDALAADGVRLRALSVNVRGSGEDQRYEANARAVAELLTAGDFQLNTVQLVGDVIGTGTDFRWLGELRAAAARYGSNSIAGLILSDVTAESRAGTLTASASRANINRLNAPGASVSGAQISDIRVRSENGVTTASLASVQAGTIEASGARINGVTASGVNLVDKDHLTTVETNQLRVGGISVEGAQVGSLNIAGVRLAIRDGRIQGSTADINAGTLTLANGRIEDVRINRPVFTVEPSGSYRASADLSLGGGILGQVNLGSARANLVATNNQIQLNNFDADVLNGRATGSAVLSTTPRGTSRVSADFSDLDVGGLLATLSQNVVALTGQATGRIDLTFPGTRFEAASGQINAQIRGETGDEARGRTHITGDLALRADRGLFGIERAELRAGSSEVRATGQFSFEGDSNVQLDLASANATELQRVIVASGIVPGLEDRLEDYGLELAGNLNFNGTIRGRLSDPLIDGRLALDSLKVNGRDLGTLNASLDSTPAEIRVTEGRLTEKDGGGLLFTATIPREGENNIAFNATFDRFSGDKLMAVLPENLRAGLGDMRSDLSGSINVTGFPGAMNGSADLRFGQGSIAGQPFQEIIARAAFDGSTISLEELTAQLPTGRLTASGSYTTTSNAFNLQAQAKDLPIALIESFIGGARRLPQLAGQVDLTASASGTLTEPSTYQIALEGQGRDVTINGRPAGVLTLVGRTEGQQFNLEFTTGLLGGERGQVVTARVDLSNNELPVTVETTLTGADLTPLFEAFLPGAATVRVTGQATGAIKLSGNLAGDEGFSLAGLRGTANFTDLAVQIEDIRLTAESPLLVQFSPAEIFFEKTRFTGPGTDILFGGTFALNESGKQNLSITGELNLRVLNGISPDVFLSGVARIGVRVNGTYADPLLTGTAQVSGASVNALVTDQRLSVSNIDGRVRFSSDQAEIESLTGRLGGGRLTVTGGALLDGFALTQFRLNLNGDNVSVPFPEDFRSTADLNIELQGTSRAQFITGTVNLRRAEYMEDIELADLISQRREASITQGGDGGGIFGARTQLDLRVEGRDALVVRNNLADVVGSVSLRIIGSLDDPIVAGRITATSGTLNFRNDRYELTRAYIDLPARRDADPLLNIQAEAEIRGYQVIVGLTGPLSQPNAIIRSEPALPQADVVSLITTGNLASDDTTTSALAQTGLGTAASLLTETLISAPAQRATDKLFGLNRFELDPLIAGRGGASPTARLTVGRQINRNLSITYSTNLTADQNQVLALEYRLSNRLSFIAQYEQGSVSGFTSRNNNFSFEIRFRRRF